MKPTSVTLQRIVSGATAVRLPGDWRMASARTIVAGVNLRHVEGDQRIAGSPPQSITSSSGCRRPAADVLPASAIAAHWANETGDGSSSNVWWTRWDANLAGVVGVVEEDVALGEVVARPRRGAGGDQVEVVVDLGDEALVQAAHQALMLFSSPLVGVVNGPLCVGLSGKRSTSWLTSSQQPK